MATIEERVAQLEVKVETFRTDLADIKGMIAALDLKMERRFDAVDRRVVWLIGIQFATLFAMIGALASVITKLL